MAFAKTCAVLVTMLLTSLTMFAATPLEIKTRSGKVEGKLAGPVRVFLGIPYAAPPVGDLRWKPPVPAANWKGVRKATEFGSRCMQSDVFGDMVFRDPGGSEDCLTLNVWTFAKSPNAKLPVMVWIYGGGFVAGGTSEQRQDGTVLAQQGVVVVSMNYRLGMFGFFVHPELVTESGRNSAGNYGLLDQVAALHWVQDNIAEFGGDPGNVTIFGESAGSFSVSALMASPLAKGLFHKAIGESGGAFFSSGLSFEPLAEREEKDSETRQHHFAREYPRRVARYTSAEVARCILQTRRRFRFWAMQRRQLPPRIGAGDLRRRQTERRAPAGGMES